MEMARSRIEPLAVQEFGRRNWPDLLVHDAAALHGVVLRSLLRAIERCLRKHSYCAAL
jgi:hypothetical protein